MKELLFVETSPGKWELKCTGTAKDLSEIARKTYPEYQWYVVEPIAYNGPFKEKV